MPGREGPRGSREGPEAGLEGRFARHLADGGWLAGEDEVVVAVSGGLDSLVLLHLLRFGGVAPGTRPVAAHFDHRMRAGSEGDALWLRGLARSWGVRLECGRAGTRLRGQAAARGARYGFLEEARRKLGARWILTAHHADDQAETVLHRILRGTGPTGLGGMPPVGPVPGGTEPSLFRPLLPFRRSELATYARRARIRHREDPSNQDPSYARTVIRRELLPRAEEAVSPGARTALVRLASLTGELNEVLDAILERLESEVVVEASADRTVLARSRLTAEPPPIGSALLRRIARGVGIRLSRSGTGAVMEFIRHGRSGGRVDLPGRWILRREYDRLVLERDPAEGAATARGPAATSVSIPDAATPGQGALRLGGRIFRVRWAPGEAPPGQWSEVFESSGISFPLTARGWRAGDRIVLSYGSKKLKKLFQERGIPSSVRATRPVLAEDGGRIVWVPGIARAHSTDRGPGPSGSAEGGVSRSGAEGAFAGPRGPRGGAGLGVCIQEVPAPGRAGSGGGE